MTHLAYYSVDGIVPACRLPLFAYVDRCTRSPFIFSEPLLYITFFSSYGLRYGNKYGLKAKYTDLRGIHTDLIKYGAYHMILIPYSGCLRKESLNSEYRILDSIIITCKIVKYLK
jgi:hypothetical protein